MPFKDYTNVSVAGEGLNHDGYNWISKEKTVASIASDRPYLLSGLYQVYLNRPRPGCQEINQS